MKTVSQYRSYLSSMGTGAAALGPRVFCSSSPARLTTASTSASAAASSFSSTTDQGQQRQQSTFSRYVSFDAAPGFYQAPLSDIGRRIEDCDPHAVQAYVIPDVITEQQEQTLLRYTNSLFDRLPFERVHEDALIHHYKEFFRSQEALMNHDEAFGVPIMDAGAAGSAGSTTEHVQSPCFSRDDIQSLRSVCQSCRQHAASHLPHIPIQDRIHFIRISANGFIRAHADESRNSSGIVAGLTLGSGRVMSLTYEAKFPGIRADILLAPRSLYMITGAARYDWAHSVDWISDDPEHVERAKQIETAGGIKSPGLSDGEDSEVIFDNQPTGMKRHTRTALIWRGLAPMELLMAKRGTFGRRPSS